MKENNRVTEQNDRNILTIMKEQLSLQTVERLVEIKRMMRPIAYYKFKKEFESIFNPDKLSNNINKEHLNIWRDAFERMMLLYPKRLEVIKAFTQHEINPVKVNQENIEQAVTLICIVKNDLQRIKNLYKHHQKIGVEQFVFIDNNSNDGTREWLIEQENTDVYLVEEEYSSPRRSGWINQVLNRYGFERWYLVLDSDELFVYDSMEKFSISDLIEYCEEHNIDRLSSIMLDMYAKDGLFKTNKNIKENYRYFDSDSYIVKNEFQGLEVRGGPRQRVMFNHSDTKAPLLTKQPLFFFRKGDLYATSHFLYPFEKTTFIGSALLHYKFLESDFKKYQEIVEKGNFAKGSIEYKNYMKSFENNEDLTFMYSGSKEYKDSSSLQVMNIIEPIHWREMQDL